MCEFSEAEDDAKGLFVHVLVLAAVVSALRLMTLVTSVVTDRSWIGVGESC